MLHAYWTSIITPGVKKVLWVEGTSLLHIMIWKETKLASSKTRLLKKNNPRENNVVNRFLVSVKTRYCGFFITRTNQAAS